MLNNSKVNFVLIGFVWENNDFWFQNWLERNFDRNVFSLFIILN